MWVNYHSGYKMNLNKNKVTKVMENMLSDKNSQNQFRNQKNKAEERTMKYVKFERHNFSIIEWRISEEI